MLPTDAQIKRVFDALEKAMGTQAQYSFVSLGGTLTRDDELFKRFIRANSSALNSASINNSAGVTVSFTPRSIPGPQGYDTPHPYYSVFSTNVADQDRPSDSVLADIQLVLAVQLTKEKLLPGHLSGDDESDTASQSALLSAVQRSAADQIARTDELMARLTEQFVERQASLERLYVDKAAHLEQLHIEKNLKLDESREQQENDISQQRDTLNQDRKALDDRSNTHARRAIRGELIMTVQERQRNFAISKDTMALRRPIHLIFLVLLAASFGGTLWSLYVWGTAGNDSWGAVTVTSAIKTAVFSFSFLTTAGLYISWMNRWFDKHAEVQFQTKQFEIDFNRATWAVEAALEWKGLQSEQMPDALLSGITKHLFDARSEEATNYSPLEALATSILGSASNLKLNMGGTQLDLDRKGIAKLKSAE
ncbi:hypothetical protein [Methylobacterium sp. J-090]|uniref:hypothetical protein n=1 Tax=Methylobacterium sp. J-090 TaxID=2836666 RepID=UPI001FB8E608|nr:hypothetical protein [Methylobacterium sp. J-090]